MRRVMILLTAVGILTIGAVGVASADHPEPGDACDSNGDAIYKNPHCDADGDHQPNGEDDTPYGPANIYGPPGGTENRTQSTSCPRRGDPGFKDEDDDGHHDSKSCDNCPDDYNANQADEDNDGRGTPCDDDEALMAALFTASYELDQVDDAEEFEDLDEVEGDDEVNAGAPLRVVARRLNNLGG